MLQSSKSWPICGSAAFDWLLGTLFGVAHALAVSRLDERVPDAYMDEEFHVAQARQYCAGNFDHWNPKITTPPLLYLLVPLLRLCGRERFVNSVLVPICFVGLCRLRRSLGQRKCKSDVTGVHLPVLAVLCVPVLLDTSLLFYTDLLSLTLLAHALATDGQRHPFKMFLAFALALFVRQTNIVWVCFPCMPVVWTALRTLLVQQSLYGTINFLTRRLWPNALLCFGFIIFLYLNGGAVVLGDRSAHRPVFHVPQLFYFCAFTAASALPQFVLYCFWVMRNGFGTKHWSAISFWRFAAVAIVAGFALVAAVHCCTLAHPYLLADNRHFTFYIWKRLFQRHRLVKYALVPAYVVCAAFLWHSMDTNTVTKVAFAVATSVCLIPAHLLEFRYFIVPYAVWRLYVGGGASQPRWVLFTELATHFVINAIALHLFFNHPFRWHSQPDRWQRFMWNKVLGAHKYIFNQFAR